MIRWSYLLPRLLFILVIYLFFYFAFDLILKRQLINVLENVFEAKVEIERVKTSFINPSIEIDNLKIGNKDKEFRNLFEFKKMEFKILSKPLFEKKFVIERASVEGLGFDTPRKTSCKIKIKKTKLPAFLKNYIDITSNYVMENISEIKSNAIDNIKLDFENLNSIKLLREIENRYNNEYRHIDEKIDLKAYKERINELTSKVEKLKKEKNLIKQLKLAMELKKEVDKVYKDFKNDQRDIEKMIEEVKNYTSEIEKAKREDIEKIASILKIPQINSKTITSALIGNEVIRRVNYYYDLSQKIARYIPDNPKKKIFEEKRKRGRIIHFVKENSYPGFWLKTFYISGVFTPENPLEYTASIENITNMPSVYKLPLKISLYGKKDISEVSVNSSIYFSSDIVRSISDVKYNGIKVSNVNFGSDKLKIYISSAIVDSSLKIKTNANNIDLYLNSIFRDTHIKPDVNITSSKSINLEISRLLSEINKFYIEIRINGEFKKPEISFKTDLADVLLNLLDRAVKKEVEGLKHKIEEKINDEINKNREKLDKRLKEKQDELKKKLRENSDKISNQLLTIQKQLVENSIIK